MADSSGLRFKIILDTSEMLFYINMVRMGTVRRIEQQMIKDGRGLERCQDCCGEETSSLCILWSETWKDPFMMTGYIDHDASF